MSHTSDVPQKEANRSKGKRSPALLQFFLMGPLLFFLWRLLKPAIASASLQSTVVAGMMISETNDMNKMLRDAMMAFGMDPASPEWVKLSKDYFANM